MWAMMDGQLMGEPWSGNFPNWGTMLNGELIPLSKPEPLITEEGGGFWATPTVNNSKNNAGPSQMDRHGPALDVQVAQYPTPTVSEAIHGHGYQMSGGRDYPTLTGDVGAAPARGGSRWPTPARMLPTPTSGGESGGPHGIRGGSSAGAKLVEIFGEEDAVAMSCGSLSPDWTSWLMGLPVGWTSLEPLPIEEYDQWFQMQQDGTWWLEERGLPRVATGIKNRVSRLKMLGNGIVPGTAALAIKELSARLL